MHTVLSETRAYCQNHLSYNGVERKRLKRRLVCTSLSLTMAGSSATPYCFANAPVPVFVAAHPMVHPAVHSAVHTSTSIVGAFGHSTGVLSPQAHRNIIQTAANQAIAANDLNLTSAVPLFQAGGLAGFHNIILDIGGKQQTVSLGIKLTASELIAAEQVVSGGKQELTINAKGAATAGYFDLNSSMVSALDKVVGGNIGSLVVPHGVKAVDSLSNLDLSGSLVNLGSITGGTASGAKGQISETITAANVFNSGTVTGSGDLNINAQSVTNSGVISSQHGNVNFGNGGSNNFKLDGTGGTVKALNGNINFNQAGNSGSGNITVNGGDYLSKQVNFNAGSGAINANVQTISGEVNGTAESSHITAATNNLNLGNICVAGDPTYFNTAGDITVSGDLTGNPDLALIASGNIIGNGGALDASQTAPGNGSGHGGNMLLVAGAFFVSPPSGSNLPPPDTTTVVTIGNNPAGGTKTGSTTGGYIDLSGVTLTGKATNKAVTEVSSAGTTGSAGNITMIAYQGSGTNSGSIVATATVKQAKGATVDATTVTGSTAGTIQVIGGGKTIAAQNLNGKTVEIDAAQPSIGGSGTTIIVQNGTVQGGSGTFQSGKIANTTTSATVGSLTAPISVNAASLSLTSDLNAKSVYVSPTSSALSLTGAALQTGSTFSLNGKSSALDVTGPVSFLGTPSKGGIISISGGKGVAVDAPINGATTATITAATGDITGSGQIQATTVNLIATLGNVTATTAATNVSVMAGFSGGNVTINENATTGKATNILNSTLANGMNFSIVSSQQINIVGKITDIDGFFGINESGTATPVGINIAGTINVGNAPNVGDIILLTHSGSIIGSKVIAAPQLALVPGGAVASAAKPLQTNTLFLQVLDIVTPSSAPVFIKDSNSGSLELSADNQIGGAITVISAAKNLTVDSMTYGNVTLQDTFAKAGQGASIVLAGQNSTSQIGNGLGTVSITSAAASIDTSAVGKGIVSANVSLNSTMSNIGNTAMTVAATTLAASAPKGTVNITDSQAVTLGAGKALNAYTINASGLTVAGAITGGTVNLKTTAASIAINANIGASTSANVQLMSANGITQGNAKAVLSGQYVLLQSNSGADIGSPAFGGQNIVTKAGTLNLIGQAGTDIYITQTGAVGIKGSTPAGFGSLTLTASGKITTDGTTAFDTIFLVSPSISVVNSSMTCSVLDAQTNAFVVPAGASVGVSTSADFFCAGALSISGGFSTIALAGGSTLTLGGAVPGKLTTSTTSVTLGDSKTGANDPLDSSINGAKLLSFAVDATGNFASGLQGITVAPPATTGVAPSISIKASNFISLGNPPFSLIRFTAPGNSSNGGSITLALTGSQAVSLSNADGSAAIGTPFELITNSDLSSHAGTISVTTTGNLTALAGGINLRETAVGGSLTLDSGKSLLVKDSLTNGYADVTIKSAATTPFLVDAGAGLTTNGTLGPVTATNLILYSSGPIETKASGSINATFTAIYVNPIGNLQIIGAVGSITTGVTLTTITFAGAKGVTFGDTKNAATSPFTDFGSFSFLNIEAPFGNFTSPISDFQLLHNAVGGNLQIGAENIVRYGIPNTVPTILGADGDKTFTPAGSITLTLTGTQDITLDSTAPPSAKVPVYEIHATGSTGGGTINIQTGGTLTVNPTGIVTSSGPANLTLSGGKGLAITDSSLLSGNTIQNVTLSSGAATPLVIQASGPVVAGGNAIVGAVTAVKTLQITDQGGITIGNGASVISGSSGTVTLITKQVVNDGTVSGGSASNLAVGTLTSPGVTFATTGAYTGFTSLTVQEAGAVNFGNLFTTTNTLSGVLSTLSVDTTGSVTLGSTAPSIATLSGGSISIIAASLLSKSTGPSIALEAQTGTLVNVVLRLTSPLTIGTIKGNISILDLDPTSSVLNLQSSGVLTLGSGGGLAPGSGILQGTSVIVNQVVNANTNLLVTATGTTGAITTQSDVIKLTAGSTLTIGENNPKQPAVGTEVSAPNVVIEAGHLGATSLINSFNGNVGVAGAGTAFPVGSLTYVSPSTVTGFTVTLGTLVMSAGGINISTMGGSMNIATASGAVIQTTGGGINLTAGTSGSGTGGSIALGANSSLSTSAGSITLLDNNLTAGVISFGTGVTMHASGTAAGVGQVSVVIGPVPTSGLAVGTLPSPTPTMLTSGTGTVTFTTSLNPTGSIGTAAGDVLNAAGRNVVFNEGALGGTISLSTNDTIVADPPTFAPGTLSIPVVTPPATVSTMSIPFQPSAVLNLAAPPISSSGLNQGLAAALNASATAVAFPVSRALPSCSDSLKGKVSNCAERFLNKGPMLMAPDVNTTAHTAFGSVDVAANAVALIIAFDGGVAVYNLHDNKRDSVVVHSGSHRLAITPGRSAVMTNRDVRYFEEINPAEFVGYRRMAAGDFGDGVKTFQAEFDARTLLQGVEPLRQLVRSGESHNQKVTSSLLKTTAILMSIGDATPFQYMVAPRVTAMSPVASKPH